MQEIEVAVEGMGLMGRTGQEKKPEQVMAEIETCIGEMMIT